MKKIALCLILASSVATPLHAQTFSGFRGEVRGGYEAFGLSVDYEDAEESFSMDGDEDGFSYGGELGYDFAIGPNGVLGVYAGLDFSNTKRCGEVFGEDEVCLKTGRNLTIGARSGIQAGPAVLAYVKGGYANGELKGTYTDFEGILDNFEESETRSGYHAGLGLESAFGPNAYGKLEYLYTDYNDADFRSTEFSAKLDGNRHQVVAGLGFRF